MPEGNTIIKFRGPVKYDTIGELIGELKKCVHRHCINTSTYKKLLLVMIESLENIMKYNEYPAIRREPDNEPHPEIMIRKRHNQYSVVTSNLLKNENVDNLRDRIDYMNSLDRQGLKDYYKHVITNGEFSQQGGAGLGLIEMAKVSPYRIHYSFHPYNADYSRFTLRVTLNDRTPV